jgi:hypothetical protein
VGTCGYVFSCLTLNGIVIGGPWLSRHWPGTLDTPEHSYWGPERMSCWGARMRKIVLTGGEILPACGYLDGRRGWCGLLPGLVLFRLLISHLQPRVVGPYLIWCIWFPNHLPMEETGSYPDFLNHNRRPVVPGVQDPNK